MEQLKNNASTTLNGAHNNSTTSLVVTDGNVFPASGNFRILVGSEIMLVTARSSNTLTVTRGYEGTTATSHSDLDPIGFIYTKGSFETLLGDYYQSGGYASRPVTPRKGTIYTATDLEASWAYDGTNWNLISPMIVPYAKRCDFSGWTALNHGSEVFTDKNGVMHTQLLASASNLRGWYKSLPTVPYKVTIVGSRFGPGGAAAGGSVTMGVGVRENATGKIRVFGYTHIMPGRVAYQFWNSETSFNSFITPVGWTYCSSTWLRFEDDNINWTMSLSHDGNHYMRYFSEARNTNFTADQIVVIFFNSVSYPGTVKVNNYMYGQWEE